MVEEHLDLCLFAGINHEGINAEVAKGQWEFQIFGKGSKRAADEMWIARYLLLRLTEKYGVDIEFHCKPLGDTDWNGSGMHANFSTAYMREVGGKDYFEALMKAFEKNSRGPHRSLWSGQPHAPDRQARDAPSIHQFSYGVADRGASIRVPHSFVNNGYKGYLEDRRPNSQGDPYQIASQILKTISAVPTGQVRRRVSFSPNRSAGLLEPGFFVTAALRGRGRAAIWRRHAPYRASAARILAAARLRAVRRRRSGRPAASWRRRPARHDVEMQVEHHLPARALVELHARKRRRPRGRPSPRARCAAPPA